ncbi:MAG TPA: discoidin domain-containing protein, partial [Armatimonadota bacterium]|nr:discoidin domain-containing protein [Armatimonadota bacterium]
MRTTAPIALLGTTLAALFAGGLRVAVAEPGANIALGKPYTFSQPTNYSKCGGPSDSTDLTDGVYTDGEPGAFWVTPTTAGWGWLHTRHVWIMADLGRVEPIAGVSFSTAGGWGGVSWPLMIDIQVSDDGERFRSAGDLVDLTRGDLPDPAARWTVRRFRYETAALQTRGRFVRLVVVPSSSFVFCDEIEITRGPDAFLALSPGVRTEERIKPERMIRLGCAHRLRLDLQRVRAELEGSQLATSAKRDALRSADRLAGRITERDFPLDTRTFRAVVPFNALHREVFALHARVLAADGGSDLRLWQNEMHAPLTPFDKPTGEGAELHVRMMRNEFRSAAFNLTNASPDARRLKLRITGLPGGTSPSHVVPHAVEFVDTRDGVVVASALVPLPREGRAYSIDVPAGMPRQVWLLFRPGDLDAGDYRGEVVLTGGGVTERVPLTISIADVRFPDDTDLFFSMWD